MKGKKALCKNISTNTEPFAVHNISAVLKKKKLILFANNFIMKTSIEYAPLEVQNRLTLLNCFGVICKIEVVKSTFHTYTTT